MKCKYEFKLTKLYIQINVSIKLFILFLNINLNWGKSKSIAGLVLTFTAEYKDMSASYHILLLRPYCTSSETLRLVLTVLTFCRRATNILWHVNVCWSYRHSRPILISQNQ